MKQESRNGALRIELLSHSVSFQAPQNLTGKFIYCGVEVDWLPGML